LNRFDHCNRDERDLIAVTSAVPTLAIPALRPHNEGHVILTLELDEVRRVDRRGRDAGDLLRQQQRQQ
jgi:hypothetical protein